MNLFSKILLLILSIISSIFQSQKQTSFTSSDPVIAAAGDISCDRNHLPGTNECQQMATSDVLLWIDPDAVLTLGDNQYPNGELSNFNEYFNPSWGQLKDRIYPTAGNHDYHTSQAQGYFDYYNGTNQNTGPAGERKKGYYSFDLDDWHLIALNTEIDMSAGSDQENWLAKDLTETPSVCTLVFMHVPLFSSGNVHGNNNAVKDLWQVMYEHSIDIVLAGHEHTYERFSPQDPNGNPDPTRGIREFIVGNGGRSLYSFGSIQTNSEFRYNDNFGVLKFTLHPKSYDWEHIIIDTNRTVVDSGTGECVR